MLKITILFGIILSVVSKVSSTGDIGPGEWYLVNVRQCENPEQYDIKLQVQQAKLNRSHDYFNANILLDQSIDNSFGVTLDICIKVDGGCKPFQKLEDDCFITFMEKYVGSNIAYERALTLAGVDPPEFPLEIGSYRIEKFLFDYCELPKAGIYGSYGVRALLTNSNNVVTACLDIDAEFRDTDTKCGSVMDDE